MIVAVFSDVHGNLPALETFLDEAGRFADTYLCLGDTVNYGPWNDECLERIAELPGAVTVEGNHECLFLNQDEVTDEHPLVQEFYRISRSFFTRTDLISGLPQTVELGSFTCTHTIDGRRIFADTDITVEANYLIGHSHYQYETYRGGRIVNPGSVGQNRHRIDHVDYGLFNTEDESFDLRSTPYDFGRFLRELRTRGYPPPCLEYYERKLARL